MLVPATKTSIIEHFDMLVDSSYGLYNKVAWLYFKNILL